MDVRKSSDSISLNLSNRQFCDLELLLNGGFAPLTQFMDRATYHRVIHEMRLPSGALWPIPIVLDITSAIRKKIEVGSPLLLKNGEGTLLATMEVSEIWTPDKAEEALLVYGTTNINHPSVRYLFEKTGDHYVFGKLTVVGSIKHFDFPKLRKAPQELKRYFQDLGIEKVVGFQTRNPMHRAHFEITVQAAKKVDAHLLLHPAVGMTKPGDIDHFSRVKCYQALLNRYEKGAVTLSLLPIAMRMAGPKEALWHAIIRKNYGCTHFIVGRDHAGPGKDENGIDFYPPNSAQELASKYSDEIQIEIVSSKEMVYVLEDQKYQPIDRVDRNKKVLNLSGTELRKKLKEGAPIPEWFTYPEVAHLLQKLYPPKPRQGFTLFFTGLSASGKSTLAKAVSARLMELQERKITLLDGDLVRTYLSSELTFSKEHRSLNVRRVGFTASEISKNGGIAICALIAPYEEDRQFNRRLIKEEGNYIEIYLNTPLSECEKRDPKGLYALARGGKIPSFTGIDDPYEPPTAPEIQIDTSKIGLEKGVETIIDYLFKEGFLSY